MSYSRKKKVKTVDKITDLCFAISIGVLLLMPLVVIVLIVRGVEIGKEFLHGKKYKR